MNLSVRKCVHIRTCVSQRVCAYLRRLRLDTRAALACLQMSDTCLCVDVCLFVLPHSRSAAAAGAHQSRAPHSAVIASVCHVRSLQHTGIEDILASERFARPPTGLSVAQTPSSRSGVVARCSASDFSEQKVTPAWRCTKRTRM